MKKIGYYSKSEEDCTYVNYVITNNKIIINSCNWRKMMKGKKAETIEKGFQNHLKRVTFKVAMHSGQKLYLKMYLW